MKKMAIAVNSFAHSQFASYFIRGANNLLHERCDIDILGVFENPAPMVATALFATMQIAEVYSYDGVVFANNFNTVAKLLKFPSLKKIYFYIQDLEWTRTQEKDYFQMRNVYANPKVTLIARCDDHKAVVEDCWNTTVLYVVKEENMIPDFVRIAFGDGA